MLEIPEDYNECMGIGISLPGIVNHQSNEIYTLFGIRGWSHVNPVKLFHEEFKDIPINVDNDANGMMLAEKWKGFITDIRCAVFLSVTDGIGSSVLESERVLYGEHSNFGEVGHLTVDLHGEPCRCGNRGCLETFASDSAIISEINKLYPEIKVSSIEKVIDLAKTRDNGIYAVLKRVADYILIAMYTVFSVYDPGLVILGSTWLPHYPELFRQISDEMYRRFPWVNERDLKLEVRDIRDMIPLSSGAIAVENFFLNPPNLLN